MRLEAERNAVVEACRAMHRARLVVNTSGNVSVRAGPVIAISPNGIPYETMAPQDVCLVEIASGQECEDGLRPSSELPLHLAIYRATDAGAIVHTHSLYATVLSSLVHELPAIHYQITDLGGPVRVAPYATFGSEALAIGTAAGLRDRRGIIMKNHGATTIGPDLRRAMARAILLEWLCQVYYLAKTAGNPTIIDPDELARVAAMQGRLAEERQRRLAARSKARS